MSDELWRRNYDVLAEGYFLTSREAFRPSNSGTRSLTY